MTDAVLSERRGRVLLVTLNRPGARNAINSELSEGLGGAMDELDRDARLTAAVLTGAGKGFCSGMDLKAFATSGPPRGLTRVLEHGTDKPMIAAVEGFAMAGGLELALCCDLLVAARGAKLGIPEVGVGLFAAGGALMRLPRRLPYGVAMEMAVTAEPITAEDAHRYGLISRLAEPGQAVEVALTLAERIARNAPLAVAASKPSSAPRKASPKKSSGRCRSPSFRACSAPTTPRKAPGRSPRSGLRPGAVARHITTINPDAYPHEAPPSVGTQRRFRCYGSSGSTPDAAGN